MKLYLFHHYLRYGSFWFIFMWKLLFDHEVKIVSRFYLFSLKSMWPSNRNLSSLGFSRCSNGKSSLDTSPLSIHSPIWFWLLIIFTFFFGADFFLLCLHIHLSFALDLVIVFVIKLSVHSAGQKLFVLLLIYFVVISPDSNSSVK